MYELFIKEHQKIIDEIEARIKSVSEELKELINYKPNLFERLNKTKILERIKKQEEKEKELDDLKMELEKKKSESFIELGMFLKMVDEGISLNFSDIKHVETLISSKDTYNSQKTIATKEDLVLVHKTNYLPIDGVLHSAKDTGAKTSDSFSYDGKSYRYEYLVGNDSLHFCLNGTVSDHDKGSWKDKKYCVLVPFDKVNVSNMISLNPEDTFFKNSVMLFEGSIIVCPKEEKEEVQKRNPGVRIVTYDNTITLDDAVKCVITYSGYKYKAITNNNWIDSDFEDNKGLETIRHQILPYVNCLVYSGGIHLQTENYLYACMFELIEKTSAIMETIIDNNIQEIINEDNLTDKFYHSERKHKIYHFEGRVTKEDVIKYIKMFVLKIKQSGFIIIEDDFNKTIESLINSLDNNQYGIIYKSIFDDINITIIKKIVEYSKTKKINNSSEEITNSLQ